MSLQNFSPIGFIPTNNAQAALTFYRDTLGLRFVQDDQFAMVFLLGPHPGSMLRVVRAGAFTPAPFTIFGWEVDDIQSTVTDLNTSGVGFERFGFLEHDPTGIWTSPDGSKVAWFKDPDGNTLSVSQHPTR